MLSKLGSGRFYNYALAGIAVAYLGLVAWLVFRPVESDTPGRRVTVLAQWEAYDAISDAGLRLADGGLGAPRCGRVSDGGWICTFEGVESLSTGAPCRFSVRVDEANNLVRALSPVCEGNAG